MSTAAHTDATEAQIDKPLRWEFEIEFSRPLDHRKDDPDRLREMLGKRAHYLHQLPGMRQHNTDVGVSVEAFDPDTGAVLVVGADDVDGRPPIPEQVRKQIQTIANRGYQDVTSGDEPPVEIHIEVRQIRDLVDDGFIDDGSTLRENESRILNELLPRGTSQNSRKAKKIHRAIGWLSDHDPEDAPSLGVDVQARTLEGARQADGLGGDRP